MAKQPRKDRRSNAVVYAGLAATVLCLYYRVVGYDFVDLDDYPYVVDNRHIAAGLTLKGLAWVLTEAYEGYWAPLTWLSYMAEAEWFGIQPAAFHATNVIIHAASACVLFAAMKRMTGAHWASAFVAALFAIHPLHVESVAWIAERKDVLSTFFYFLTLWAYARYVERPAPARYLLVATLFACALMSKPMAVTLPLALLLLDVWPLRRTGRGVLPLVREKAPLLAMSLVVAGVTVVVQRHAGAVVSLDIASPMTRVANATISAATYLVKMVWPTGLAALYPYPRELALWPAVGALLVLAGISISVVRARHRAPYLLVGWLWYLVTVFPVLGFIQAGPQARADRYTYVAMTGISIMSVWGLVQAAGGLRHRRALLAAAACVSLTLASAITWKQIEYWRDTESLFRRALAVTSGNYIAHNALGAALRQQGRIEDALGHLRAAVALAPDYADAHSNLGEALLATGRADEAIVHAARAVQLQPSTDAFRVNLGSALSEVGRNDEAEAEYRQALRLSPASYQAHSGLGLTLQRRGDLEAARLELESAIRLNPAYADAHLNLGAVLARMGREEEAARAYNNFSRLNPTAPEGHMALGTLLAKGGRMNEAIVEFAAALRARPADADLHTNLAVTLAAAGRIDEAIEHFVEAVRLRPDRPELRENLDLALQMRAGRRGPAPAPTTARSPER